ncbi:MAG: DMT family transporter [Planctomycetaceae bacterium]|nr:DMT family transporter [Planctomycetaceae bacterium]
MQWILLSLMSALVLGFYGIAKKRAVDGNPVPPVLLLQVSTAAALWLPSIALRYWSPAWADTWLRESPLAVQALNACQHFCLACKSFLVGASWTLALYGVKHLPLSVSAPIRATSPLWTILIAVSLLGERPVPWQWCGIATVMLAFFLLSRASRQEGIDFHNNRAVVAMIAATLLGSASALYDKQLLQRFDFTPATVQAWFSVYLVPVMLPLSLRWFYRDRRDQPLQLRASIFAVAMTLLLADFCYFAALRDPDALISVISPLRRASVVVPFAYGILYLKESNGLRKAACVALLILGVVILCQG